ncbi:MAG TPA: branched-chain amino acid ABC transporter permease, partial [Alphaproteobacteria bacterium]|nr:branched-chain amino acid ABC transporter permease [Alphaproteobacteria bacterium]
MELGPYLILGLLEGLVTAAVLALMALGLSLVFGVMRVVNVAHGEFFMIGAVLAWWIADAVGSHPAFAFPAAGFMAAILIAPVLTAMLAMAADQLVLKRLDYDPERTIVATIGLLYIIQQVTLMSFGPDARPVEAPFNHRLPIPFVEWQAG